MTHLDDEKFVANAVNELIRYCPVQQNGQRRVAVSDVQIGEVEVRPGDGIICANGAANFDERVFQDPYRLDLTGLTQARISALASGRTRALRRAWHAWS